MSDDQKQTVKLGTPGTIVLVLFLLVVMGVVVLGIINQTRLVKAATSGNKGAMAVLGAEAVGNIFSPGSNRLIIA